METRRVPRVKISLKITSRVDEEARQKFSLSKGKSFEVEGVDISVMGIGILSPYFLPKGLLLHLEIDGAPFNLSEAMKVKGEVRYCKYIKPSVYRCGLQFEKISKEYNKAIGKFISLYERRKAPRLKLSD